VGDAVRERWAEAGGFVIIAPAGVAVRSVAPLLGDKRSDPAVVSVDDRGRWSIALTGGHAGGANELAREVAALLGAEPVVTTGTDMAGLPGLDDLPGFEATGQVAAVTRRWLDGEAPSVALDPALTGWTLPEPLAGLAGRSAGREAGWRITVTDSSRPAGAREVVLRPKSVVVGVGSSTGSDPEGLLESVTHALRAADADSSSVEAVATIDVKVDEPSIRDLADRLGARLLGLPAAALEATAGARGVPNPSRIVASAVGTPSVAEAAALLAGGPGSTLILAKQVSRTGDSTVAVARRLRPAGNLAVVGVGPGDPAMRTPEATAAVRHADVVAGYGPYVDLVADLIRPAHSVLRYPIGSEVERCTEALSRAAGGEHVALVSSGDPGVYAMASLVLELAPAHGDPPVTVVAGLTAASSAAAILGAPLGHDHAAISLSDLLTPWATIRRRIQAAAEGDFVVSLYNPRSGRRTTQLAEAIRILSRHRPPSTPAAVLTSIGRPGQEVLRTVVSELSPATAGMLSLVMVGSSRTRWIGPRMVTPRGYPSRR
jgi:cobalt-precorrin 5A hydrolase/precorrin-3B C17-methyltransferase